MPKKNHRPSILLISILALIWVGFLVTFLVSHQLVPQVFAERMESDNYVIQFGNFNITSGTKTSDSYNLTDTVGQTAAGPFGAYGTTNFIGSGFQYIYQGKIFSFALSKTVIDLGQLVPDQHNTDTQTVTVTAQGSGGYTVYVYERTPLRQTAGTDEIPDTKCDDGTCDEVIAKTWTNQSIPGFGFNISGNDVMADFSGSSFFRQFANQDNSETMQKIMGRDSISQNRQATVTYKAGVDAEQTPGEYQTEVVFVAVPGY